MKRNFTILMSMLGLIAMQGQSTFLDTNNLKMNVRPTGDIGWEYGVNGCLSPATAAPSSSNKTFLFASSLWMGGMEENSTLHLAANNYLQSGSDFSGGPVATVYDSSYDATYNRSWSISIDQIENHIANYGEPGYTIPEVIANWPANGDVSNGMSAKLAPFEDLNGNDIYEPLLGEHPLIRGDKAVLVIYNDDREINFSSGGNSIGAEVHLMMYGYDSSDEDISNTVFLHYEIFNRGIYNLSDFKVGRWEDWDLGFYNDDQVGCDLDRNLSFVNNGDSNDEGINAYGTHPPAAGMVVLNESMDAHMYYNNTLDTVDGYPVTAIHYYNYMSGKMKDGSSYEVDSVATSYMFPGTTDPAFPGLNITEDYFNDEPGDRRAINATNIGDFNEGTSICLDYAYVFAWDTTNTNFENLDFLKERVDSVQAFYDNHFVDCSDFSVDIENLGVVELLEQSGFEAWYVSNSNTWRIRNSDSEAQMVELTISNIHGQILDIQKWDTTRDFKLNKGTKASGLYYISIHKKGTVFNFPILFK